LNAELPIEITDDGIITVARLLQFKKVDSPIEVILSGIEAEISFSQLLKA
jgi:hypothetical protein